MMRCPWSTGLAAVALATAPLPAAPLGPPGTVATYALNAGPAQRHGFERERKLTVVEMSLELGPTALADGRELQRVCLSFARLNSQTYEAWVLLDGWSQADRSPQVARYLWREPDWPDAVEFVNEATGTAQLPRLSLWEYGWPQGLTGAFPEAVRFQCYPFKRAASPLPSPSLPGDLPSPGPLLAAGRFSHHQPPPPFLLRESRLHPAGPAERRQLALA